MTKDWYENALASLLTTLRSSDDSKISGSKFLQDYFIENNDKYFLASYNDAEDLDEIVRNEIDGFQAWLKNNSLEIRVGKRYNWSLQRLRKKRVVDTSISLELDTDEAEVDKKQIAEVSEFEIAILERVLSKIRNSDDVDKIHELTIKIANWYELKSDSISKKAMWWECAIESSRAVPVSSSHKYYLKAAEYLSKYAEYKRSGDLYESGFDLYLTEFNYPNSKLDNEKLSSAVCISKKARANYSLALESKLESSLFIKECDLINDHNNFAKKTMMKLYKLVSAYGESPGRVLLTSLFVIVVCAGTYIFTGVKGSKGCQDILISDALYYSVVTFSTLGYGDITPCSLLSKVAASFQAIFGLVLTSLFIVTFVRKFHR
jgi:hypothetical protein